MRPMVFLLISAIFVGLLSPAGAAPVAEEKLEKTIALYLPTVPQFQALRMEAAKRGLKVWLLGGGAASVAEHAKQTILHKGQLNVRHSWWLTNILLPEQDLDLVLTRADGKPESSAEIASFLDWVKQAYPIKADGRSRWDAIGLKTAQPQRNKMALEGNPDFLNQHNDALSLGMIELTEPTPGESLIKDLSPRGNFLRTAAGDELQFLFSPDHHQTTRFLAGENPPILAVVRSVEKALRYGKKFDPASLKTMEKIIADWDPKSVKTDSYVYRYLMGRGKRVLTHALDLEQALALLNQTKLRKKLLALPGSNPAVVESLAWWLNRKPLPRVGSGIASGKTAGELGIKKAYHYTSNSVARLISWNYDSSPRLFASRKDTPGENSYFSEGFYTFRDEKNKSAWTQPTANTLVEFDVDPKAQLGKDFTLHDNIMVWKGTEHLKVVQSGPSTFPLNTTCSGLYANVATAAVPVAANNQRPVTNWMNKHPVLSLAGLTAIGGGVIYATGGRSEPSADETEISPAEEWANKERLCFHAMASAKEEEMIRRCGRYVPANSWMTAQKIVQREGPNFVAGDDLTRWFMYGLQPGEVDCLDLALKLPSRNDRDFFLSCWGAEQLPPDTAPILAFAQKLKEEKALIRAEAFSWLRKLPLEGLGECTSLLGGAESLAKAHRLPDCLRLSPEERRELKSVLKEFETAGLGVPFRLALFPTSVAEWKRTGPLRDLILEEIPELAESKALANTREWILSLQDPLALECVETFARSRLYPTDAEYRGYCESFPRNPQVAAFFREAKRAYGKSSQTPFYPIYIKSIDTEDEIACGREFIELGFAKASPQMEAACSFGDNVGPTAPLRRKILTYYRESRDQLHKDDSLGLLAILKTDLARHCAGALVDAGLLPFRAEGIAACREIKSEAAVPLLVQAIEESKDRQIWPSLALFSKLKTPPQIACVEAFQAAGVSVVSDSDVIAKVCAEEKNPVKNLALLSRAIKAHFATLPVEQFRKIASVEKAPEARCVEGLIESDTLHQIGMGMDALNQCEKVRRIEVAEFLHGAFAYYDKNVLRREAFADFTQITDEQIKCVQGIPGRAPFSDEAKTKCLGKRTPGNAP